AAADSGCDENAQLMCERSNYGLCWSQRKSWHYGDDRVMDVLLGLMHCWQCSGEPYIPVCPSVGRNLGELSAGDLPQQGLRARDRFLSNPCSLSLAPLTLRPHNGLSANATA